MEKITSKYKPNNSKIIFNLGNQTKELIRLEKGKFFWKGKEIKDVNKIYERFSEWMNMAEKINN